MQTSEQTDLERIYGLVASGASRKATTVIFDVIDDRLLDNEAEAVGRMLDAVVLDRLNAVTALAFLTITLVSKDRLPTRPQLVARVEAWLAARERPERVEALMKGLV